MAKFVVSNRRAGKRPHELKASRDKVERALKTLGAGVQVTADRQAADPAGRRTVEVEMDAREMRAKKKRLHPDVIVEPKIEIEFHGPASGAATSLGSSATIHVRIVGGGKGLWGAQAIPVLVQNGKLAPGAPATTGKDGQAVLQLSGAVPKFVIAQPAASFWAMYTDKPALDLRFDCPALPHDGPIGWWHRVLGVQHYDVSAGQGIRVGILGTGVGPHPDLKHVTRLHGKGDLLAHDTLVCGVMAARPKLATNYAGLAPGARYFAGRIVERDPQGQVQTQDQGFIANMIETLADNAGEYRVDLLNMSFGSSQRSEILHDGIRVARQHGTLCICSAGNNFGSSVHFPAAFAESIAVTALGRRHWGPKGSVTDFYVPTDPSRFGADHLYFPSFSNLGKQIFCTAPGSGVISTAPARFGQKAPYVETDGTSLASPAVCATLTLLLAGNARYRALPRDASRTAMARAILQSHCTGIGLAADLQGHGIPRLK